MNHAVIESYILDKEKANIQRTFGTSSEADKNHAAVIKAAQDVLLIWQKIQDDDLQESAVLGALGGDSKNMTLATRNNLSNEFMELAREMLDLAVELQVGEGEEYVELKAKAEEMSDALREATEDLRR